MVALTKQLPQSPVAAGCAVFLAPELSSVTGTTVNMDGGALAADGFYRVHNADGTWTHMPMVTAPIATEGQVAGKICLPSRTTRWRTSLVSAIRQVFVSSAS